MDDFTTPSVAEPEPAIPWSDEQKAIFEWARNGKGNLVVRARAGSGKSSSIVEAITYAPEDRILVAAFNKDIQVDLQRKLKNNNAQAKTLHALGFSFVKRNWPDAEVDSSGARAKHLVYRAIYDLWPAELIGDLPRPLFADFEPEEEGGVKLAAKILTSTRDINPFATTEKQVLDVIYDLDILPEPYLENKGWTCLLLAKITLKAMDFALERSKIIDFADMVFLPLRLNWAIPTYSLVCVDEAQDMNIGQLELAMRVCRKGGRIAVVGDDRQAIYGFRGADSNSVDRLKKELSATELGLTITFRCPRLVVEYVNTIVPDLRMRPEAPDGIIQSIKADELVKLAKPGDFVLSRLNAPLMKACLALIREGTRARILGRDIGQRLATIAKKLKAYDIRTFYEKLGVWAAKEIARAKKVQRHSRVQLICDQADCLRALLFKINKLDELYTRIDQIFGDRSSSVVQLSTVHKAKGLEADRVFVLRDTLYPGSWSKDKQEEQNIEYVAVTRAKNTLVWVDGFNPKKNKKSSTEPQAWEDPRWNDPPWAEEDYGDDKPENETGSEVGLDYPTIAVEDSGL
jgi:DNA helicase-2/ATP-dependent DNA helicase PcrA